MEHGRIEDSLFCLGMAIAKDLPDVEYETIDLHAMKEAKGTLKNGDKVNVYVHPKINTIRRPHEWDCEVYSFPQTWGHGSTIFGGMGPASFVTAQVTVILHKRSAAVYVGRQLGYVIPFFSATLMDDVRSHRIANVSEKDKYNGIRYEG